jgi:hypothetical protein
MAEQQQRTTWPKVLSDKDVKQAADQWQGRGPSLASLVEYINRRCPDVSARLFEASYQSKRHLYAHVASFGKLRAATYLTVMERSTGRIAFRHNTAEAYARNQQVARWIVDHLREAKAKAKEA